MGLSPWQLKRQFAWWLGQQAFSETPQGLVLTGGSLVSEDSPGDFRPGDREVDGPVAIGLQADGGFQPFAIVTSESYEWDDESMERLSSVLLVARIVAGGGFGTPNATNGIDPGSKGNTSAAGYDTHGINQVTGALRASPNGQGQAQGRDVDELVSRIAELVGKTGFVDSVHGFQGRFVDASAMGKVFGSQVLERVIAVEVVNGTPSNQYHAPPRKPTLTNQGGGTVNVSWLAVPSRYDSKSYVVRRGTNPSDPAPTSPTGGANVPLTGSLTAQATGLVTGRTYNFSVFAAYDETGSGTPDRYSSAVSNSVNT